MGPLRTATNANITGLQVLLATAVQQVGVDLVISEQLSAILCNLTQNLHDLHL